MRPGNSTPTTTGLPSLPRCKAARHVEEIVFGITLLLPAVGVEVLAEITLLIQQSDGDERQAEIARRLQVIAREDSEAAGVNRKALMQAELRGK